MVTTRRTSFGTQDGETLALRSRSVPVSTESTPSRKRKDNTTSSGSSSKKKRKSPGSVDADGAVAGHTQEIESPLNENESSLAESTSGTANGQETSSCPEKLNGKVDESGKPEAWLENDFVSLSSGAPAHRLFNGGQEEAVANSDEQITSSESPPIGRSDRNTVSTTSRNDSQSEGLTKSESGDVSPSLNQGGDQKLPVQAAPPNVHKRFGSEEPITVREQVATAEVQAHEHTVSSANGDVGDAPSDEEAPEVVGSKLTSKDIRPVIKAPRKAKRKAKPSKNMNEQPIPVEVKRARAGEDLLFIDSLPKHISNAAPDFSHRLPESATNMSKTIPSHQQSKKRKLLDNREKKPKDIFKDGVIYRTFSDPQPIILSSKNHKASHLPPKSTSSNWRLRKQVLGRKRVPHVWGGRSAFLQS